MSTRVPYRRIAAALVLAMGLTYASTGSVFAQEHKSGEGVSEEHKGGVPEVSVFWKWANFAILFGVLALLASKQAAPLLRKRTEEITEGLAVGERAKADAETRAKAVDAKLANLDGEVEKMRVQAREDREREAARLEREALKETDRIRHQADMEIESAGKQAAVEVRHFGARLALELAESKVRARMSPETQAALLNNFVRKVAEGAAKSPVA